MSERLLANFFYAQPVARAYAIEHPFVEPGAGARLELPREWDWVLDDHLMS